MFSVFACGNADTQTPDAGSQTHGAEEGSDGTAAGGALKDADDNGRYDSITMALSNDPAELLPWNCKANAKPPVYNAIYDTLFDFIDGEYINRAAKGYTVIDPTHYQVELYDYITDWNGNNITAQDVVECYERFIDAGYLRRWSYFGKVTAVGDYVVEFEWAFEPTDMGPFEHIWCQVPIYSSSEWNEDTWATKPVGTGPYIVEEFTAGSKIVLTYNENYWQPEELRTQHQQANVDRLEFDIITESSQAVIGLQQGTIDVAYYLADEAFESFQNSDTLQCVSLPSTDFWALLPNCDSSALTSDVNMRKAIFYAIDSDAVAEAMAGTFACHGFGSVACPDYVAATEEKTTFANTCDPELAKEYLAKTAYNGEELLLVTSTSEQYKNAAMVMQVCLENVGIRTKINAVDQTILDTSLSEPSAWDLMIFGAGGTFITNEVDKLFNAANQNNEYALGFIKDDELQRLVQEACNVKTHGDATITALGDYCIENAYSWIMIGIDLRAVVTKDCIIPENDKVYIFPSCSTYNLD